MTDPQTRYQGQGSDSLEAGAESSSSGTPASGGGQAVGEVVQQSKDAVKQTAQETVETAKQAAQDISEQVQQQAGDVIEQTAEQVANTAAQVKQQATTAFVDQRDRAVSGLGSLADALRQTAKSLGEAGGQDDQGGQITSGIAPIIDEAAERLSQSAEFLKDKDITGLLGEAQQLAKKQPMLFMGGMFAVGLIGARLLKGAVSEGDAEGGAGGQSSPDPRQSGGMDKNWFDSGSDRDPAGSSISSVTGGMGTSGAVSVGSVSEAGSISPSGTSIFDDIPAEPRTGTMTGGSISGGISSMADADKPGSPS